MRANHIIPILLSVICLMAPGLIDAQTDIFSRNLGLGSRGDDVLTLQKILNAFPETQITLSGSGSPGFETTYFGQKTAEAVRRFQEIHRAEILLPFGMTRGTGFVGPATLKKLRAVSLSATPKKEPTKISASVVPSTPVTFSSATSSDIYIISPSPYYGPIGSAVSFSGAGFDQKNNRLIFKASKTSNVFQFDGVASADRTTLRLNVPTNLPLGKYVVAVETPAGRSSKDTFFIVTASNSKPPVVENITPESGPYGTRVTVKGQNFTQNDNELYTNYLIFSNLTSADGTTITFDALPFPNIPELQPGVNLNQNLDVPLYIFVVNGNGVSDGNKPSKFIIKI